MSSQTTAPGPTGTWVTRHRKLAATVLGVLAVVLVAIALLAS